MDSTLEKVHHTIPAPEAHSKAASQLEPHHSVLLKDDQQTPITLYPITNGPGSIPSGLVNFLHSEFNAEIERGCTYPMEETMSTETFAEYWFGISAVVVLTGADTQIHDGRDWESECLGTFYIKPNYPGE
jgi:hypothetical protein